MIIYEPDLKIYYSSFINDNAIFSGFSTKPLGDGKYHIENIFKFFDSNYIAYKKVVIPEQIHSINLEVFNSKNNENLEKREETDGLITKEKGVVLTVVTADCLPLIYADKSQGVVGISHQGWRGSVKRMAQKMVDKMVENGAALDSIKIALGPTIGECCYNIDDDRYYEFREEFDGYTDKIFHRRSGQWHLNLALLNYLLLLEKGLKKENIDFFPFCTKCDEERFFSFRRDKKADYGEMFSFVLMT